MSKDKISANSNVIRGYRAQRVLLHLVLILCSFIMLVPFLWMVLTSFKTQSESISVDPFIIFPKTWVLDSYENVIRNMAFGTLYWNTLRLIFWRIFSAVLTATMAGYAFSRLKFKGRDFCFSLVILQMMMPAQVFVIPQYVMVSKLNLGNTMLGLVFPGLVTAFGTFLLRQAYRTLPRDLEDAARIDGCNIGQTFLYIMAPLTRSAMVSLGIFTAIFAYKDLLWPMIVAPSNRATTLAPALAKLQGQFVTKYPELMAAAVIASLPMIVIFLIFQNQFMEGIATSGGKL